MRPHPGGRPGRGRPEVRRRGDQSVLLQRGEVQRVGLGRPRDVRREDVCPRLRGPRSALRILLNCDDEREMRERQRVEGRSRRSNVNYTIK